jgi:hypothetical protein
MITPEALQPPLDTPLMIWAPELAPRWLNAVLTRRWGYSTPRWKVWGVQGPGFDKKRAAFPHRLFKPVAWKLP